MSVTSVLWKDSFNKWDVQRCSFVCSLKVRQPVSGVKSCCRDLLDHMNAHLDTRHTHLWRNVFPLGSKILSCHLSGVSQCMHEKTGLSPFMWAFPSNYPFYISQPVGACQNRRNIRTPQFCLHSMRLQGGGGGGGERWAMILMKIMRVEGFSGGVLWN